RRESLLLGASFSGPRALLLAPRRPPGLRGVILCASFARSPLPRFVRWLGGLVWPCWFRAAPTSLVCRTLLGRYRTPPLSRMVRTALAAVRPAVLAARARAIVAAGVGEGRPAPPRPPLHPPP